MLKLIKANLPLLIIIFIGLFFRLHNYAGFFQYSHENDLQAWIIRNILVDHHYRLIGQETSMTGVFIGPLYYYTLALFFSLASMDPLVSVIPVTVIGILTLISVYYVFSKTFGKTVGTIGSFIYAISLPIAFLDRWAFPTQPTLLWAIWFFYVLVTFAKGKFNTLPILILLVALIWHVHVAFIPLVPLVLIAIYLSKRPLKDFIPQLKKRATVVSVLLAVILLVPFFAFEIRHGFQQTKSILVATHEGNSVITGKYKKEIILENVNRVLTRYLYKDDNKSFGKIDIVPITFIGFLVLIFFLYKKKTLTKNETLLIFLWIADVILVQSISKRPIEEYYFNNLIIITLAVFSVFIGYIYKHKKSRKLIILSGTLVLLFNVNSILHKNSLSDEYVDRMATTQFIATDMAKNNFSCVAITYIGKPGVGYGFRYLFWLNKVNLVTPGAGVPVYNLAIPSSISENEVTKTFGSIGVILPKNYKIDPSVCKDNSRQLLDLNGYVD